MAVAGEIARLIVDLQLQDHGFAGKVNSIGQALGRMDTGLSRMGRGVGQVGSGLARLGTVAAAAAAGGLTAVVTTAASMEEAFIGVQKTVDETASFTFTELRDVLRTMSVETGTAFEELSRIGEIGGALGVSIESLDEFIDVVNRLGVSTDLSVEDAATALGHLGTVLGLTGDQFEDVADGLVALGNAGASSEAQIVAIAERFAVAGKRAGLTTAEILALASATASMGIEVEAGGTALSNTFNQIAVAIGTGGKEVEAFTDLLGINAAEFRRRWEKDALGTFQEFLREVDKLPAIEQAVALEAAGITGVRQQNAVGALADQYQELGRQLAVVEDRQGALKVESDKFFASTATGFRRVREGLRLAADAIGTELLPVANELTTEFVKFLILPSTQKALKDFGTALAEGIRSFVSELKGTDFSGLLSGMKFAADAAKVAFDAFRSLPEPIQQLAIAALVANKVSGGAVGQIAKGLTNIAFGGLQAAISGGLKGGLAGLLGGRGASPLNPMFVAVTNQVPGAGGGPTVVGGGGVGSVIKTFLGVGTAVGLGAILGDAIGKNIFFNPTIKPAVDFETGEVARVAASGNLGELNKGIDAINAGLNDLENVDKQIFNVAGQQVRLGFIANLLTGEQTSLLQDQKEVLESARDDIVNATQNASSASTAWSSRQLSAFAGLTNEQRNAASAARATTSAVSSVAQRVAEQRASTERGFANQAGYLNTISRKNFSPTVNVSARISNVVTVNANRVLERITEARVRTGTIPEFA